MDAAIRTFRDLKVWQMGMDLASVVYALVNKLPREEAYALSDQLRRAVVSVPANIAEGHAREQTKAYLAHLAIAAGSLAELETLLVVAQRLGYSQPAEYSAALARTENLRRALNGLRASLRRRLTPSEARTVFPLS